GPDPRPDGRRRTRDARLGPAGVGASQLSRTGRIRPPRRPAMHTVQGAPGVGHYTRGNTSAGDRVGKGVMTSMSPNPALHHAFPPSQRKGGGSMILFRQELGDVLRNA